MNFAAQAYFKLGEIKKFHENEHRIIQTTETRNERNSCSLGKVPGSTATPRRRRGSLAHHLAPQGADGAAGAPAPKAQSAVRAR